MEKLKWTLSLTAPMAGIAFMYPIISVLDGTINPVLLSFFRFSIASVALTPLILYRRSFALPSKKELLVLLAISFCAVIPTSLVSLGIEMTNSIVAATLVNTNPLIVTLLAPFLIGERITVKKILGLVLGFAGVVAVIFNGQNPFTNVGDAYLMGAFITLGGALLSALNKIYSKNLVRKYDGLYVTFLGVVFGTIMLGCLEGFKNGFHDIPQLTPWTILLLITLGVVNTALPWTIWSSSLKHLDIHVAASFNLLVPVFAALYSLVFLSEKFTFWILIGLAFVCIGIYVVQREEAVTPNT